MFVKYSIKFDSFLIYFVKGFHLPQINHVFHFLRNFLENEGPKVVRVTLIMLEQLWH